MYGTAKIFVLRFLYSAKNHCKNQIRGIQIQLKQVQKYNSTLNVPVKV